jgi:hypothetical protein
MVQPDGGSVEQGQSNRPWNCVEFVNVGHPHPELQCEFKVTIEFRSSYTLGMPIASVGGVSVDHNVLLRRRCRPALVKRLGVVA